MTEAGPSAGFSRIVVELGSAAVGSTADILDLAGDLAEALEAELATLFVEEEQLFDLADLPLGLAAQSGASGLARPDRLALEQVLARQASRCRRALARRAEAAALSWSFEVRRGDPLHLIQSVAGPGDLVIVSGTMAGVTIRSAVEMARQAAAMAAAVLVAPPERRHRRGAIAVINEAGRTTGGVIDSAERLASALHEELVLLPWPPVTTTIDMGQFHRWPREPLSPTAASQDICVAAAKSVLGGLKPRLLVTDLAGAAAQDGVEMLSYLVRAARAPLLVMRPHTDPLTAKSP